MDKAVTEVDDSWIDLLNSDWHDHLGSGRREDRLDNPVWLRGFLRRWGTPGSACADPETRAALRRLRSLLRAMVDQVLADQPVTRKDWNALNRVLAGGHMIRRMEKTRKGFEIKLVPRNGGLEAVLADIAASFAGVFAHGDPSRIKICHNPDCHWVIYDRSKSRTRRWCEGPSGCGNLMKVRRHRARRKDRAKGGG